MGVRNGVAIVPLVCAQQQQCGIHNDCVHSNDEGPTAMAAHLGTSIMLEAWYEKCLLEGRASSHLHLQQTLQEHCKQVMLSYQRRR